MELRLLDPPPQAFNAAVVHEPGGWSPQQAPAPELELVLEQDAISDEEHEPGGSEPQHFLLPELELVQAFISDEVHEPGGSELQHFLLLPPGA